MREYIAMRSLYHLKEADPQAWVIPRLEGEAKAGLVSVEHDEYGAGRGDRMHARLFADMMLELDLSDAYGTYLDVAPAEVLAEVNLMSMVGLRRSLRGALVGQFAVVELTSSPAPSGSSARPSGSGSVRRRSASTPSTSRPTPSTSRSSATASSPRSSPPTRRWPPTSCSACRRRCCSTSGCRSGSWRAGPRAARRCGQPLPEG